jgi:hypothetical protein
MSAAANGSDNGTIDAAPVRFVTNAEGGETSANTGRLIGYKEEGEQMDLKTNQEATASRTGRLQRATQCGPDTLDASLGFALMKDRRICIWQKTRALATGAAIVAGAILVSALGARWAGVGGRTLSVWPDGFAFGSGTLLFGSLFLKRLAPREVVSRVRCERYRVIPLRKRTMDAVVRKRASNGADPLAALGYASPETKEYAVIPRRNR